jgi:hypothetical protein
MGPVRQDLQEELIMLRSRPALGPALLPAFLVIAALVVASPLLAYTLYLKDGRTVACKGKYQIVNGKAIVVLQNGTQASLNPAEIDVRKSDEMNKRDYGSAEVLDLGNTSPTGVPQPREKSLADLISSKEAGPRNMPGARRDPARNSPAGTATDTSMGPAPKASKSRSGYPDLMTLPRNPYPQAEVSSELRQFFLGQKTEEVAVYTGSQAGRPLVEVTTGSEGAVFRALAVGANALLHVRGRFPQVSEIELVMVTPERDRAGQFVLTPEMATDLVAKRVDLISFYVANVQF